MGSIHAPPSYQQRCRLELTIIIIGLKRKSGLVMIVTLIKEVTSGQHPTLLSMSPNIPHAALFRDQNGSPLSTTDNHSLGKAGGG